jgi:tetratricopeptide (TPR) repeat protein
MGYVYYEKDNHDEALENYDRSLSVCPYHVRAFYNRSLVRQEFGHFSKAISDIDRILSINPNLSEVYSLRGWSNVSRAKYVEAAVDYRNSLPRTSALDHVVSAYLDILVCIGHIDEAMEQSYLLYEQNKCVNRHLRRFFVFVY